MHVTEREREKERERERERRKTECVKDADANGIAERAEEGGIRSRHSSNSRDPMLHYLNARSERRANMFVSFCQSSCPLFKSIWKSDVNAERRARDANDRILCSRVVHRLQVIQVHRAGLKMSQCVVGPQPPILATSPPNKASRCVNGVTF